jgi:hypothetical protein
MSPSKKECEETLNEIRGSEIFAYGIMASGYVKLPDAVDYANNLPNVKGIVIGVSKKEQATETFKLVKEKIKGLLSVSI